MCSRGVVQHANALGHAALAANREVVTKLRDVALRRVPDDDVELTYLSSPGCPVHMLVIFRSLAADVERKIRLATSRWRLTPREAQVLEKLIMGAANKEVAAGLGCSERTVEVHVTHLFAKSGYWSRLALIAHLWTMR